MLPNEVKPYTESYQYLWKHRKNYQEFRFNVMNMLVDDGYDKKTTKINAKTIKKCEHKSLYRSASYSGDATFCRDCGVMVVSAHGDLLLPAEWKQPEFPKEQEIQNLEKSLEEFRTKALERATIDHKEIQKLKDQIGKYEIVISEKVQKIVAALQILNEFPETHHFESGDDWYIAYTKDGKPVVNAQRDWLERLRAALEGETK